MTTTILNIWIIRNAARQILDEISASTSATFIIASKGIEQDISTW